MSMRLVLLVFVVLLSHMIEARTLLKTNDIQILTQMPQQGSLIIGQLTDKQLIGHVQIYFENKRLTQNQQGYFVFGVGRDAPKQIELIVKKENQPYVFPIKIKQRQWNIERIDGLPPTKVNPKSKVVLAKIKSEAQLVRQARNKSSQAEAFLMDFMLPAKGRISGVYGSQRILNGEAKRPHFGLDIANKTGTPVIAPVDGTVSLVHRNMFYSGGTLIVDHGYGVSSTYIHLNSIDVKLGEVVKQGDKIGTIGATGRVTGPHLDWRVNWFQTRLDPQLLIQIH